MKHYETSNQRLFASRGEIVSIPCQQVYVSLPRRFLLNIYEYEFTQISEYIQMSPDVDAFVRTQV